MILKGCVKGKNTTETLFETLQINKSKVERIYEDEDWVVDKVGNNIRVSYFKNNHFVDERLLTREELESVDNYTKNISKPTGVNFFDEMVKTDNGWYHINDIQPNSEEEVIVILERERSDGCTYDFTVCESIYRSGYPQGYFLKENSAWKVRYWRRKELIPYPNGVVRREIEECKRHNFNPYKIIEHQKMCGIEVID